MSHREFTGLPLFVQVAALALAYYISGRIGLLLAIPPGYATAVWPASGVAVAALLLFGYRLWPGVIIGSFLINVFVAFDGSSLPSTIHSTALAASIGTGAALQALAGAWLVNRKIDLPSGLTEAGEVGWFIALSGPVSCLVNASWGCTTLWLFKAISAEEVGFSWLTWWVGDVIGVVVFLPVLFAFLGRPAAIWQWRRLPLVGPMALSVAIVVIFFFLASAAEQKRIESRFQTRFDRAARTFKNQWKNYVDALYAVHGLMTITDRISQDQFGQFLNDKGRPRPGLQALAWLPKVSESRRSVFETSMRQNGDLRFGITELIPGGGMAKAGSRPYYIPVQCISPMTGNDRALGFDLSSEPTRRRALEKARDSGRPVATPGVVLIRETGGPEGILVFIPVYGGPGIPAAVADRRRTLRGFALGVFRMGDFLANALKGMEIDNTQMVLEDETRPDGPATLVVYQISESGTGRLLGKESPRSAGNHLARSTRLEVFGRTWRLSIAPTAQYLARNRSWSAWGVLAVGLMFTGLLGTFLLILTGVSFVNKERAAKLTALNTELSNEITERRQSEKDLADSEEKYRLAMEATTDGLWDWDIVSGDVYFNPAWARILEEEEVAPVYGSWADRIHPEDREETISSLQRHLDGQSGLWKKEHRLKTKTGKWKWVMGRGRVVEASDAGQPLRMVGTMTDISERKQLETQLRQAQKMESVGRLAGGVAHDFNNMLSIILGNTELILDDIHPSSAFIQNFKEIQKAAERSSDLTRQLLAFARKQTISPQVTDLNQVIGGMLKMLMRLIGEDIELLWRPNASLWAVKIDPSQIDQILANLCVNARDAIKDVGKVTIETDNAHLDEASCREGSSPGDYAVIRVIDDGSGMGRQTIDKLFEPFYTTKNFGEGTGLGLATVYGIVRQNNGFIDVDSEPGQGSTFKIYLPRHLKGEKEAPGENLGKKPGKGNETILLVEDEEGMLQMTRTMLQRLGYRVLAAKTPDEALAVRTASKTGIDLLLTDVVMPAMNGRELAEKIKTSFPRIKCLFMSGYTANVIAHRGVLDEGLNFITKPFGQNDLAAKLREILD